MTYFDSTMPYFHHPIKVIFLDDNRQFLDALDLEFGEKFDMLTFTESEEALRAITKHGQYITNNVFKITNDVNNDTTTERVIGFEVNNLLSRIYDKTRFDEAAILVVDYEMPDINGIDFCHKLKETKIFKIMLTAEADKDIAIKAFNDGVIHKFILKTNEELHSELALAIQELTRGYFRNVLNNIINAHNHLTNALFSNPLYLQLFSGVVSQTQAVEYYLVDNSGSFVFFDEKAKPTWLIVKHNKELDEQIELLHGYDVPDQIMNGVIKKEKILFLPSSSEYKKTVGDWVKYMFDSKKLDDNYYYSIVSGQLTDSIDWERVVSYSAYKEEKLA